MISRTGIHLQQPLSGLTLHSLIQKVYGAAGGEKHSESVPRVRLSAKRCVTNKDFTLLDVVRLSWKEEFGRLFLLNLPEKNVFI
jgi:hypothetical protein